jgi:Ser/Thr protein kinase RdoA (MazF antagonist)
MGRLLRSLTGKWGLARAEGDEFYWLREAWRARGCMWEDRAVLVHGDATPSNLLFGKGRDVIAIDLERMQWADRVFDLGRLCGELKHCFFRTTGDLFTAEPFIGHFLWEYCGHFPDRESAFRSITRRIPFYMGITLLRIARNSWIDGDYRWRLIHEARQILKAPT